MTVMNVFSLLGGLGLFLFGMKIMGDGLEKQAGGSLKNVLKKMTSNPFKGMLLGAGVTAIIQSSSATTVMLVGFVNSGIMQLVCHFWHFSRHILQFCLLIRPNMTDMPVDIAHSVFFSEMHFSF